MIESSLDEKWEDLVLIQTLLLTLAFNKAHTGTCPHSWLPLAVRLQALPQRLLTPGYGPSLRDLGLC